MEITTEQQETVCNNGTSECIPDEEFGEIFQKIEKKPKKVISNIDRKKVMKKIGCEDELCVAKKVMPQLVKDYFKPKGPRNNDNLLSNFDIDDVLDGWCKSKFPTFYHIYYQMIDFGKTNSELARVDVAAMFHEKNYNCMGVVLNTDVSSGRGKHWFCMFVDWRKKNKGQHKDDRDLLTLEYFNSSGNKPRPEVEGWLIATHHRLAAANIKSEIIQNRRQHQIDSNTECGPYSLYYIWSRLHGVPYTKFHNKRIEDKDMYKFRKVLFR
jgi:hypothetical protein